MFRVLTAKRSSLLFFYFTFQFLLVLVITLALSGPISHAEPPSGSILSDKKSLLVPAVMVTDISLPTVTISMRTIAAIPTQALAGLSFSKGTDTSWLLSEASGIVPA